MTGTAGNAPSARQRMLHTSYEGHKHMPRNTMNRNTMNRNTMTDHKKRAAQNNLHGNIYDHLIEAWTMAEPRPPMGHSFGLSFTSYHPDVQQYLHDFVFRVIQGLLDDGCLQQPDQPDEWEQCRFEDVKDTDLNVRFVFDDGSIIQGKPHMRRLTEIDL